MRTYVLRAVVAATAALALSACGGDGSDDVSAVDASGLAPITVAAVQGGVMPVDFRAGIDEGIFEKHGLKVTVETLATGLDNISAAVQGSADIGYSDIFGGASARSNGFDVKLVLPHNGNSAFNYLLVPDDSPIEKAADLDGTKIAIGAPPLFRTIASIALLNAGVDPSSVSFTIVKDQTTFAALLKSKQVDAAFVSSVISAEKWIAEDNFRTLLDTNAVEQGIPADTAVAGWWATTEWFDKNDDTAARFRDAIVESQSWYQALPPEKQAGYVKEQTGADPIELEKSLPGLLVKLTTQGYSPQAGPVDESALTSWLAEGGKYSDVPPTKLNDLLFPTAREQ